jgi:hypothetical protein
MLVPVPLIAVISLLCAWIAVCILGATYNLMKAIRLIRQREDRIAAGRKNSN